MKTILIIVFCALITLQLNAQTVEQLPNIGFEYEIVDIANFQGNTAILVRKTSGENALFELNVLELQNNEWKFLPNQILDSESNLQRSGFSGPRVKYDNYGSLWVSGHSLYNFKGTGWKAYSILPNIDYDSIVRPGYYDFKFDSDNNIWVQTNALSNTSLLFFRNEEFFVTSIFENYKFMEGKNPLEIHSNFDLINDYPIFYSSGLFKAKPAGSIENIVTSISSSMKIQHLFVENSEKVWILLSSNNNRGVHLIEKEGESVNISSDPSYPGFNPISMVKIKEGTYLLLLSTLSSNRVTPLYLLENNTTFTKVNNSEFWNNASVYSNNLTSNWESSATDFLNRLKGDSSRQFVRFGLLDTDSEGNLWVVSNQYVIKVPNVVTSVSNNQIQNLQVYPNPTKNMITLKGLPVNVKEVQIVNVNGTIVKSLQNEFTTIKMNDVSNGLYLVKVISTKGEITTTTFIKQF